jgi:hypothetical protein
MPCDGDDGDVIGIAEADTQAAIRKRLQEYVYCQIESGHFTRRSSVARVVTQTGVEELVIARVYVCRLGGELWKTLLIELMRWYIRVGAELFRSVLLQGVLKKSLTHVAGTIHFYNNLLVQSTSHGAARRNRVKLLLLNILSYRSIKDISNYPSR